MYVQKFIVSLVLTTALSGVAWAADDGTNNPDPLDFGTLTPALQQDVQAFGTGMLDEFESPDDITGGSAAQRKSNYLTPNHPQPQPDVPFSSSRRIKAVPNASVPKQIRPDSLIEKIKIPGKNNYSIKFKTLPDVMPSTTMWTSYISTPHGIFPKVDPFLRPPGTNMLPTVYKNLVNNNPNNPEEIPNTLPSTKKRPYNLHDGDPTVTRINPESPIEDLRYILENVYEVLTGEAYKALYEALADESVKERLEKIYKKVTPPPDTDDGDDEDENGQKRPEDRIDEIKKNRQLLRHLLGQAVDIIEGNDDPGSKVPGDRAYRGFSLLNHSGHKRVRCVEPVYDGTGNIIGANANVHQIWYGGRIQSDAMFLDFGWKNNGNDSSVARACDDGKNPAAIPPNVPWTITYTVDALDASGDDFSPTAMYFDCPEALRFGQNEEPLEVNGLEENCPGPDLQLPGGKVKWSKKKLPTGFAMDQSFFPMEPGTRTVFKIKMAPAQYYKLTYTWGWRVHAPRAQAIENAHQGAPPGPNKTNLVELERIVFTDDKTRAIAMLSDLAPAKRMWRAFRGALVNVDRIDADDTAFRDVLTQMLDARQAYLDWIDRTKLPSGVKADPGSDLTVLFVNNTMYAQFNKGGLTFPEWRKRIETPDDADDNGIENRNKLKLSLINADYFLHGYVNVDFGGLRGWENQFKPSIKSAGSGSFFTFGRFYHRPNLKPGTIAVQPARAYWDDDKTKQVFDLNAQFPPQATDWFDPTGRQLDLSNDADFAIFAALPAPKVIVPEVHRVMFEYNFEPSRRLRFYQFDPLHHDVAIYSVH